MVGILIPSTLDIVQFSVAKSEERKNNSYALSEIKFNFVKPLLVKKSLQTEA